MRQSWHVIEPAVEMIDNWHVGAICEHLEAVSRGELRKLLINIPPGHMKSTIVSVAWPAWSWLAKPSWRGIFASYAMPLATRDSVKCRNLIESEWYRESFLDPLPEDRRWELTRDTNRKDMFINTMTGSRQCLSVGSSGTGFRGNVVAVDDPINATDAHSKAKRDEVIRWWDETMPTRLTNPKRDGFVIIMQRLHEEDLSGHVLAKGGYEHLCLPSEFDSKRRSRTYVTKPIAPELADARAQLLDVLSSRTAKPRVHKPAIAGVREFFWQDPRTTDGELLFEERFPSEVLDDDRKAMGSAGYAGQHGQSPAPAEGLLFKRAWWRFWKPDGVESNAQHPRPRHCYEGPARPLPKTHSQIISLDAAFKDLATSDYVVFIVIGVEGANRYILDRVRAKLTFSQTCEQMRLLSAKWPHAYRKLIEDKANGTAIVDTLKSEIHGVIAVEPEGGKEARAAAVQPSIEAGQVYLPEGAPWLDEFVDEFATFPKGKHDDQVDALSQGLRALMTSPDMARAIGLARL